MRRSTLSAVLISIIVLSTIVVYSAEAAGIPKKAISTVARFLETDLPTTTVFTDQANTFNAGLKQIFQASGTTAGINVAGVSTDPSSLSQGDVWYNSGSINALKFSASGGTQTIAAYTGSCSTNQVLVYSTSTNTWSCGSNGIASINSDTTAAQTIQGVSGNTTVSTSSGTTTINTGQNVVVTNGNKQTISKTLNLKGGDITTSVCSNGQFLQYKVSNQTWVCGNAMTSINTSTVGSQTIQGSGNNVTVNTVIGTGVTTVSTGTNIVVKDHPNQYSAGQKQTFQASSTTAGMNFGGVSSDPSSPSAGDIWRNTSTDTMKLQTSNTTKTIPAYGGTCSSNQLLSYSQAGNQWICVTPPITLACSTTLGSAAASYSCTNIGAYRYYKVFMNVTGLSAAGYVEMQFNGDTTSGHYTFFTLQYNSGTKTSVTSSGTYIGVDDPKTTVATARFITCDIWSLASTGAYVHCRASYDGANIVDQVISDGYWSGAAQINEIDVKSSATTISSGSGITVWGLNSP